MSGKRNNTIMSDTTEFYAALSEDYDLMTRDAERWRDAVEKYRRWRAESGFNTALDAGCGTGGEALAMAEAGFKVIGIDATPEFLAIASRKAVERKLVADFRTDDLRGLESVSDRSVDLVVCRGNTLPHLLTDSDLTAALAAFARVTRPGGRIILQWLNYTPILREKRRLVGVTGDERKVFIRFYDFNPDGSLQFNILTLDYNPSTDGWKSALADWHTTELKPWSAEEVQRRLAIYGWYEIALFSDINSTPFDSALSKDVVLTARRS
jgi:SAM-dependent methyltransferase